MVLFKKKFLLVGALVVGGLFFSSCESEDSPTPPAPVQATVTVKFSQKKGDIQVGTPIKISVTPVDKEVQIYYEIVSAGNTTALTKENYAQFTKYTGPFNVPDGTVYAVAVKNSVAVSEIASVTYKQVDYTVYKLPKGGEGKIPTWTKSVDGVQNLPDLYLHGEASNVTAELVAALEAKKNDSSFFKKPKNYIVMIGDGMGVSQVVAATQHRGELLMNKLPYKAVANSFTRENTNGKGDVTDSGAGGTKISTGYRTTKLFAGIDAEGNELMNLSELARSKGKKVGIVTNAELADATPADFTVHNKNRSQGWTKICQQEVLFGADLFMGGSDSSLTGAISSYGQTSALGQKIKMNTRLEHIISNWENTDLMWNLFGGGDKTLGRWNYSDQYTPSMQQQMALSLARLQKVSGDEGFFLMFENTYTDIYGHWNSGFAKETKEYKNTAVEDESLRNLTGIVNEVKDFDECIAIALKFVLENPDTVLLITADHETGDMKFLKGWEDDIYMLYATSGSHSNQNVPIFAIGYGMSSLDKKNGAHFTVDECTLADSTVLDNAVCGQVIGNLMNDAENSFGGDINSDTRGRSRDTFTVTANAAAQSFEFVINQNTLPMNSGEHIQFKIKPYAEDAVITIKDAAGTAVAKDLVFSENKENKIQKDSSSNVTTLLSKAYKHAFVSTSEAMDGWYQFSIAAPAKTETLSVSITGGSTPIAAGTEVLIDDFTVQYASTKGYVTITGDNVTAVTNKIGY